MLRVMQKLQRVLMAYQKIVEIRVKMAFIELFEQNPNIRAITVEINRSMGFVGRNIMEYRLWTCW